MHRFNPVAAQVLLGLEGVDNNIEPHSLAIIASCYEITHTIPTLAEFAEAFNTLLYARAIEIDGDNVSLANFGRDIINAARSKANTEIQPQELLEFVYKELSGYKLKSMCNRTVWTQEQYQQAIDLLCDTHK